MVGALWPEHGHLLVREVVGDAPVEVHVGPGHEVLHEGENAER